MPDIEAMTKQLNDQLKRESEPCISVAEHVVMMILGLVRNYIPFA